MRFVVLFCVCVLRFQKIEGGENAVFIVTAATQSFVFSWEFA
jgi:hypothetical protein